MGGRLHPEYAGAPGFFLGDLVEKGFSAIYVYPQTLSGNRSRSRLKIAWSIKGNAEIPRHRRVTKSPPVAPTRGTSRCRHLDALGIPANEFVDHFGRKVSVNISWILQ